MPTAPTEVDRACEAARDALEAWSREPGPRADALDSLAAALDSRRDEILRVTSEETALTVSELAPEFARMTGTLRMFAGAVREGSWVRAAIDRATKDAVGPGHDVRSMLVPLGPVAVFGASNFPLAYGVCGGDTASALAAGCPVVVKEHPAHPKAGRLIAGIAREALAAAGHPDVVGYVENPDPRDHAVARDLVSHRSIAAVGFTGSLAGGKALDSIARQRRLPIPVFAEMGSVNPVVVTLAAATERGPAIADLLADSILLRFGQQCTCPGLIFVPPIRGAAAAMVSRLAERLAAAPGRDMLAPWVRDGYAKRLDQCATIAGVITLVRGNPAPGPRGGGTALLQTNIETLRLSPSLQEEIFGPAAIIVEIADDDNLGDEFLGALTWTIHLGDHELAGRSLAHAARRAGRVIINGVPTGVRASHAMVHGGPYPSSNRPDSTAVGPFAMDRWCRRVCWQNAPEAILPPELHDDNPCHIRRFDQGRMN